MCELNFCYFPHDASTPQNATVADKDTFKGPSKEVSKCKNVNVLVELLERNVRAIDAIFLIHVDVKVRKVWVEPVEDSHDCFVVLEHQEKQKHQVQNRHAENHTPNGGMRPSKRSIRKSKHRNHTEEENHTNDSRPDIVFHCSLIPIEEEKNDKLIFI